MFVDEDNETNNNLHGDTVNQVKKEFEQVKDDDNNTNVDEDNENNTNALHDDIAVHR